MTEAQAEAERGDRGHGSHSATPSLRSSRPSTQKDFHDAIRDALRVLGTRERLIYHMHVVDGLTVERIAGAYRVSQSTVSRWLSKARATVLAEVRRLLHKQFQLSDTDLESILGLMISQLDISVSQVLGDGFIRRT